VKHEDDKIIAFERAGLLFVFSFHPEKSFTDYRIGVSRAGKYKIVLDSDSKDFGGFERISQHTEYFSQPIHSGNWPQSLQVWTVICCWSNVSVDLHSQSNWAGFRPRRKVKIETVPLPSTALFIFSH
jgi:hypothetical protein